MGNTIINHPPNHHRCYNPFPVMGGLWHCFKHIFPWVWGTGAHIHLPPQANQGHLAGANFFDGPPFLLGLSEHRASLKIHVKNHHFSPKKLAHTQVSDKPQYHIVDLRCICISSYPMVSSQISMIGAIPTF